jgi:hypothetical protein
MKYFILLSILLTGCSELQLQQAASFMQELDKALVAQKQGADSSPSSTTSAYNSASSSSNSSNTAASRPTTTPITTTPYSTTNAYSTQSNSTTTSNSASNSSYGAGTSNNSSSSSSNGSRQVQTVPTAMGCVKATRPAGKQWAELYNSCSFPITVSWCYAGTSDCRNGTWGTTSTGNIQAGSSRSASTFISQAGRYTVFYIACQGANTSAIETSATNYYCKP